MRNECMLNLTLTIGAHIDLSAKNPCSNIILDLPSRFRPLFRLTWDDIYTKPYPDHRCPHWLVCREPMKQYYTGPSLTFPTPLYFMDWCEMIYILNLTLTIGAHMHLSAENPCSNIILDLPSRFRRQMTYTLNLTLTIGAHMDLSAENPCSNIILDLPSRFRPLSP